VAVANSTNECCKGEVRHCRYSILLHSAYRNSPETRIEKSSLFYLPGEMLCLSTFFESYKFFLTEYSEYL
jgi:hypothetical protein